MARRTAVADKVWKLSRPVQLTPSIGTQEATVVVA